MSEAPDTPDRLQAIRSEEQRIDAADSRVDAKVAISTETDPATRDAQNKAWTDAYIGKTNVLLEQLRSARQLENALLESRGQWQKLQSVRVNVETTTVALLKRRTGVTEIVAGLNEYQTQVDAFIASLRTEQTGATNRSAPEGAKSTRSDAAHSTLEIARTRSDKSALLLAYDEVIAANADEATYLRTQPATPARTERIAALDAALVTYRAERAQVAAALSDKAPEVERALRVRSDRASDRVRGLPLTGDKRTRFGAYDEIITANEAELVHLRTYPNPATQTVSTGETVAVRIAALEAAMPGYRAQRAEATGGPDASLDAMKADPVRTTVNRWMRGSADERAATDASKGPPNLTNWERRCADMTKTITETYGADTVLMVDRRVVLLNALPAPLREALGFTQSIDTARLAVQMSQKALAEGGPNGGLLTKDFDERVRALRYTTGTKIDARVADARQRLMQRTQELLDSSNRGDDAAMRGRIADVASARQALDAALLEQGQLQEFDLAEGLMRAHAAGQAGDIRTQDILYMSLDRQYGPVIKARFPELAERITAARLRTTNLTAGDLQLGKYPSFVELSRDFEIDGKTEQSDEAARLAFMRKQMRQPFSSIDLSALEGQPPQLDILPVFAEDLTDVMVKRDGDTPVENRAKRNANGLVEIDLTAPVRISTRDNFGPPKCGFDIARYQGPWTTNGRGIRPLNVPAGKIALQPNSPDDDFPILADEKDFHSVNAGGVVAHGVLFDQSARDMMQKVPAGQTLVLRRAPRDCKTEQHSRTSLGRVKDSWTVVVRSSCDTVTAADLAYAKVDGGRGEEKLQIAGVRGPESSHDFGAIKKTHGEQLHDLVQTLDNDPQTGTLFGAIGRAQHSLDFLSKVMEAKQSGRLENITADLYQQTSREARGLLTLLGSRQVQESVNTTMERLQRLETLARSSGDSEMARQLRARIDSLRGVADMLKPDGYMKDICSFILDESRFRESGLLGWIKENGPKIIVGAAACALAIATLGVASPVIVAALSSAALIAGNELVDEFTFQAHQAKGDEHYSRGSTLGNYLRQKKALDDRRAKGEQVPNIDFLDAVAVPYAQEWLVGFVTFLGAGAAGEAIGALTSKMAQNSGFVQALLKNTGRAEKILEKAKVMQEQAAKLQAGGSGAVFEHAFIGGLKDLPALMALETGAHAAFDAAGLDQISNHLASFVSLATIIATKRFSPVRLPKAGELSASVKIERAPNETQAQARAAADAELAKSGMQVTETGGRDPTSGLTVEYVVDAVRPAPAAGRPEIALDPAVRRDTLQVKQFLKQNGDLPDGARRALANEYLGGEPLTDAEWKAVCDAHAKPGAIDEGNVMKNALKLRRLFETFGKENPRVMKLMDAGFCGAPADATAIVRPAPGSEPIAGEFKDASDAALTDRCRFLEAEQTRSPSTLRFAEITTIKAELKLRESRPAPSAPKPSPEAAGPDPADLTKISTERLNAQLKNLERLDVDAEFRVALSEIEGYDVPALTEMMAKKQFDKAEAFIIDTLNQDHIPPSPETIARAVLPIKRIRDVFEMPAKIKAELARREAAKKDALPGAGGSNPPEKPAPAEVKPDTPINEVDLMSRLSLGMEVEIEGKTYVLHRESREPGFLVMREVGTNTKTNPRMDKALVLEAARKKVQSLTGEALPSPDVIVEAPAAPVQPAPNLPRQAPAPQPPAPEQVTKPLQVADLKVGTEYVVLRSSGAWEAGWKYFGLEAHPRTGVAMHTFDRVIDGKHFSTRFTDAELAKNVRPDAAPPVSARPKAASDPAPVQPRAEAGAEGKGPRWDRIAKDSSQPPRTQDLLQQGFIPEHSVTIDGQTFHLTDPFLDGKGRIYVIAYVEVNGQMRPRLFYQSQSEGSWRSPGVTLFGGHLNKGKHYTQETQLAGPLALHLSARMESLLKTKQLTTREGFSTTTYFDFGKLSERSMVELKEAEPEYYKDKGQLGGLQEYGAGSFMTRSDKPFARFGESDVKNMARACEKLPPGFVPDFTKGPVESHASQHLIAGPTTVEKYFGTLDGRKVEWHMAYDTQGRVWVEKICFADARVNSFGTHDEIINSGFLTNKPFDYDTQARPLTDIGLTRPSSHHDYVDITPLLDKLPPIRQFREARGIRKPK